MSERYDCQFCLAEHPDIRCDETHCDVAGPGKPFDKSQCRPCWVRLGGLNQAQPAKPPPLPRTQPCFYLGEVLDRRGMACVKNWLRQCAVHGRCTTGDLQAGVACCVTCRDYEAF